MSNGRPTMGTNPTTTEQGTRQSYLILFFGTFLPMLLLAALLSSKQNWEPYAPNWLNAMTEQRVAFLVMLTGNAGIAVLIRALAKAGRTIETGFAGIAGIATFSAGHAHITDAGASWQEQVLAVLIALTLVPAIPIVTNWISALPMQLNRLRKSQLGMLLLLGTLSVAMPIVSILLMEWWFDGYIAQVRTITALIGKAILSVAGGLFAIAVIGYFVWLPLSLILFIIRKFRKKTGGRPPDEK